MLFLPVYIFRKSMESWEIPHFEVEYDAYFDENWNLRKTGKASKFCATYLLGGLRFGAFC